MQRRYHRSRSKLIRARAQTERALHRWLTTKSETDRRRYRRWQRKERYLRRLHAREGRALHRHRTRYREGVDMAYAGDLSPRDLHRAGKDFVCRYLTSESESMCISRSELRRWRENGIDVVLVFEESNTAALGGRDQGRRDAYRAKKLAHAAGAPDDCVIYFAIDFDVSGAQVAAYFRGIAEVLPHRRIGAYGGLRPISYLFDHDMIAYGWQTYAWSHHAWDHRAHLRQVLIDLPGHPLTIAGLHVDFDKTTAADFGQIKAVRKGKTAAELIDEHRRP